MKSPESIANSTPDSHGTVCAMCGAWRGAYGLEPTIEMYVQHTVEILREIRRVLRPDGVVFWNIGDSYSGGQSRGRSEPSGKQSTNHGTDWFSGNGRGDNAPDLKPKDLCLIPARVALAAQADVSVRNGREESWWVRSLIIWAKPNPMPESVTDRPTDAYEHIIMMTKSERYFWDADAVREPAESNRAPDTRRQMAHRKTNGKVRGTDERWEETYRPTSRNLRNVWTFPTQPYSGAHFATFPEEIPRRCILAATSAKGACAQCGAPWERVARSAVQFNSGSGKAGSPPNGKNGADYEQALSGDYDIRMGPVVESQTIGWRPTCLCRGQHARTVPCLGLDPFGGSGTTARVAIELNRQAVAVDLAYGRSSEEDRAAGREYHVLADRRTRNVQRRLL